MSTGELTPRGSLDRPLVRFRLERKGGPDDKMKLIIRIPVMSWANDAIKGIQKSQDQPTSPIMLELLSTLTQNQLVNTYESMRAILTEHLESGINGPTAPAKLVALHNSLCVLGFQIYRGLLKNTIPHESERLTKSSVDAVMSYLQQLLNTKDCRIGIHCAWEGQKALMFPWALVFESETTLKLAESEKCFLKCWGFRHAITQDIAGVGNPLALLLPSKPSVLRLVDNSMDINDNLALETVANCAVALHSAGNLFVDGCHGPNLDSKSAAEEAFKAIADDIVYFFGHSEGGDNRTPYLQFSDNTKYFPDNGPLPMYTRGEDTPHLVVINGCNSGAVSILREESLIGSFCCRKGQDAGRFVNQTYCAHCVCTIHRVDKRYAAHFGYLLGHFLLGQGLALEESLLEARRVLLVSPHHRWPHGLLYTVLSPGGLRVHATS